MLIDVENFILQIYKYIYIEIFKNIYKLKKFPTWKKYTSQNVNNAEQLLIFLLLMKELNYRVNSIILLTAIVQQIFKDYTIR